jgi:hypothetical protein
MLYHRSEGFVPERDIWSLCVGLGVGGKSMFLPPPSSPPPPGLDPKIVVFEEKRKESTVFKEKHRKVVLLDEKQRKVVLWEEKQRKVLLLEVKPYMQNHM